MKNCALHARCFPKEGQKYFQINKLLGELTLPYQNNKNNNNNNKTQTQWTYAIKKQNKWNRNRTMGKNSTYTNKQENLSIWNMWTSKHKKKCLNSWITRETHIKTTLRYYFIPIWQKLRNLIKPSIGAIMSSLIHFWWEFVSVKLLLGNNLALFSNVENMKFIY